jgi:hypothetical protein
LGTLSSQGAIRHCGRARAGVWRGAACRGSSAHRRRARAAVGQCGSRAATPTHLCLVDVVVKHEALLGERDRLPLADPPLGELRAVVGHLRAGRASGSTSTCSKMLALSQGHTAQPEGGSPQRRPNCHRTLSTSMQPPKAQMQANTKWYSSSFLSGGGAPRTLSLGRMPSRILQMVITCCCLRCVVCVCGGGVVCTLRCVRGCRQGQALRQNRQARVHVRTCARTWLTAGSGTTALKLRRQCSRQGST